MAEPVPSIPAAAEAARYALLRRIAPSMRHHLVVHLQPIGMVYEIMERRLRAPQPNLAEVHEGAHKINTYARAALASCLDVITWLAPDEAATIAPGEGVRELLALVQTAFNFRGFSLRDDGGEPAGEVKRSAFRSVVTGALLHLSDDSAPPALITLDCEPADDVLSIVLAAQPGAGESQGFATAPAYRPLTWADVEALAAAESVQVRRDGSRISVRLPWVRKNG